ncbi:MAG: hypothetical protein WCO44_10120 [Bacteroidota bacterium]
MKRKLPKLAVVLLFITMPLGGILAEPPDGPPPDPGGDPGPGGTPVGAPVGNGAVFLITLGVGYGIRKLYQLRTDHPVEIQTGF